MKVSKYKGEDLLSAIMRIVDKNGLRSKKKVFIHTSIAIILGIVLSLILKDKISVNTDSFVSYISSVGLISGALLAVSLAVYLFFVGSFTDRRNKYISELKLTSKELRAQMEKSVSMYPDISRKLSALYEMSIKYIPGQEIDIKSISDAEVQFYNWVKETLKGKAKGLDAGDEASYHSFEMHMKDASMRVKDVKQALLMLYLAYEESKVVRTFAPVITTWVLIIVVSMVFAVLGSAGVNCVSVNLSILIVTVYLLLLAILALMMDVIAIMRITRGMEEGWEKAMDEISREEDEEA